MVRETSGEVACEKGWVWAGLASLGPECHPYPGTHAVSPVGQGEPHLLRGDAAVASISTLEDLYVQGQAWGQPHSPSRQPRGWSGGDHPHHQPGGEPLHQPCAASHP